MITTKSFCSEQLNEKLTIENSPEGILSAWTALEVLSPANFKKPQDLSGGDPSRIGFIKNGVVPWEGEGENPQPKKHLYYHVVLGSINLEAVSKKLGEVYGDSRFEIPAMKGESILASITVDRAGMFIGEKGITVSSFGWGVVQALSGNLSALGDWVYEESRLISELQEIINELGVGEKEKSLETRKSLSAVKIEAIYKTLMGALGLHEDLVREPYFVIRKHVSPKQDSPDSLLLNSFFLSDLAKAKSLFKEQSATSNLKYYLGTLKPSVQKDLLDDEEALESTVAPQFFPLARWPGFGRYPLTLLQQAAVNLSSNELKDRGILAVNGPPGTGKTTLLRDVVASVVTNRATHLIQYDDPADAFIHSGEKLKLGNAWIHLYKLESNICGHEILVASSNNSAVENISKELPGISAIANDIPELTYFKTLSDSLLESDTWGAIAAVLGNAKNRYHFSQKFWWDEDCGLSTYLAAAAGKPTEIDEKDPITGKTVSRLPRITVEDNAPSGKGEALRRWTVAKDEFKQAIETSDRVLKIYEEARKISATLLPLENQKKLAFRVLMQANSDEQRIAQLLVEAQGSSAEIQTQEKKAASALEKHRCFRPNLLRCLFKTGSYRSWKKTNELLQAEYLPLKASWEVAVAEVDRLQRNLGECRNSVKKATNEYESLSRKANLLVESIDALKEKLGGSFVDQEFFEQSHKDRQKCAPWLDLRAQKVRDDVFVKAIALHKAFIDAAAKPLRHNLGALMSVFNGHKLVGSEKQALMPDLWTSLFLVVPVVSTTFASLDSMVGDLPPESLGWLLVDEAGQALPQAAVGAVMRSKRVVVVGDPIQIEPIVTLSDALTESICRHFGVDPNLYNAPAASVQTLADAATAYSGEFLDKNGSRTVGVPLLVHRRCADPMFAISNSIGYNRLMVNAKTSSKSFIRDILGDSQWFDIHGSFDDKWCPEEGEVVVKLLEQLAYAGLSPDIFIITPFVVIQDGLRKRILKSGVLKNWVEDEWGWLNDRVGTVHVAQGREAEAVILVLGAPSIQHAGARSWAGRRPNLLNVAVTRAKEAIYVVGNRGLWKDAGVFKELDSRLPRT